MTTKHAGVGIMLGGLLFALAIVGNARAQSSDAEAAIQFPVAELGGCTSKKECKTYCDDSAHIEACIAFAEKNGLMPKEEIETAKKFIAAGAKGPGGCTGKESCEAYCNDIDHIDVCVAFAEENGMMSGDELEEAKKVRAAIKNGVKPPACRGKKECDAYCESSDHMEECITFAKQAGLMSAEDEANAEKMLQAIRSGAKPPACRGKEECDAYCSKDENFDECVAFGEAAGFMSTEEAEMAKKTRGKGPGGCRGKEECDAFCTSSDENEEICMNFQVENDLMPEERKREMEGDKQKMRDSFSNMPPEVASCLTEKLGADKVEKLKNGELRPNRTVGESMGACFRQFEEQRIQNEGQQRQMRQRPEGEEGGRPPLQEFNREFNGPRPPEGAFRCEGENCRPPEGAFQPPPEGEFRPPEGDYPPPPPPEGFVQPEAPVEPAPMSAPVEPAPVPTTELINTITAEPLPAAAILFLRTFGFPKI